MVKYIFILIFILILNCVFSDVIMVSEEIIPFLILLFPLVIFIETLALNRLIVSKKLKKIRFSKILLIVSIANIFSFLVGLLLRMIGSFAIDILYDLFIIGNILQISYIFFFLIISIVTEFFIFYIFLGKYFNLTRLLFLSVVVNILSYVFIYVYLYISYTISFFIAEQRHREELERFFRKHQLETELMFGCERLKFFGCETVNTSYIVVIFDANRDGTINSKDTLFELCKNWFNIQSDIECKRLCNCSISIQ